MLIAAALAFVLAHSAVQQIPLDANRYGATVERGKYLATAGNCATCHTKAGGQPFTGGVKFETPFGVLYSTNITPDKVTGIGNWTFSDFYNSMKHGVRPDGAHLYPAFPYTAFAKMTDEDIAALFLYIRTIKPVAVPQTPNKMGFPFSQRPLLAFWKLLFHNPSTFQPDQKQSAAWNRGAYLVEGPGHCGACHTPRNIFGAEKQNLALSGGIYTDKVRMGHSRQWSAVNLTPTESGLAAWSEADIVGYLKHGINERYVVHGPMNEVVMNSTSHLVEADLQAIATYLKGIPANPRKSGPTPNQEIVAAGKIAYIVHCGSCHLPGGEGDSGMGVPLLGNLVVQAPDPHALINTILYGPDLPPAPFVVERSRMKMYGKRLSDTDIANIASYVRFSFGNQSGAVTPNQVKEQR